MSIVKNFFSQQAYWLLSKAVVKTHGLPAAAMLAELLDKWSFHSRRGALIEEKWFYHERDVIEKQIGLSPHEQRLAMKKFESFIETKRMGVPCKNYYSVNEEKLLVFLNSLENI